MGIFSFIRSRLYIPALVCAILLSGSLVAQIPNPDAAILFDRNSIGGTARTAGAGGAFSSVGADLGSMDLNPAGLGLFKSSDISITPGIHISAGQSQYDGTSTGANHTILELAQGGAAFYIKPKHQSDRPGRYSLRSITIGINYQTDNSFDRNQSFGAYNQSHSLVDNYAYVSNQQQTNQWSLESYLFSLAGILGPANANGTYSSNVKAPVQQAGSLDTRGGVQHISLGLGGNMGDKIFFGFSLGIPILNYSVNTQMSESNANPNDTITHFQNYSLSSNVSESGVGLTGKAGLIYKPVDWMRFGISYSLPTWYFLSENYNSDLIYSFDTIQPTEIGPGSIPEYNYRLRTPMKGTVGASFYLNEHGFISVDYELQNLGSTHYDFTDTTRSYLNPLINSYMKSTYGYSHTVRVGIEGVIKKFRMRAGYSYANSPFKSGQNYTAGSYNASVQSATLGMGLLFKHFYLDLAYVFSYSKDGVSPNFQIPLDQINSQYFSHSVLLTLGFKIGHKDDTEPTKTRRRQSDELPKFIDPGDKY